MATQDISQLVVEVKSTGIQTAANQLDKLATSADKAEAAVKKLGTLVVSTSASTATAQAQAATSGVNNAQTTATQILSIAQKRDIELYNLRVSGEARMRAITEKRDMGEYTAAQTQAEKIAAIQQKRDMELYAGAVASAERIKGIQEKRDIELYTAAVANAERIKGIQEKRDVELYTEANAQAEKIKAIQQKRDMEEYTEAVAQAERIAGIQQKRDMELYTERVDAAAKQKAIQEKRDMEEYTAAKTEAERIVAIEQKRDIELYEARVAGNAKMMAEEEKQRRLNAAFQTASLTSQIRTATQAQAYGSMGGNAAATFGTAAATADITALTAAQARLAEATKAAAAAQAAENAALAEAEALARGLAGSLGALWVTYGNLIGTAAGLAIGASLIEVVKVGVEVGNTMDAIRIKTNKSTEDMQVLGDAVLDIGKGINGPQDVAKALQALSLAGLSAKDSVAAITPAINMAVAGGTTLEASTRALLTIGSAVGANAKEYTYLADGITEAAHTSLATVENVASSMARASSVNKLYGASFDDILVQIAALSKLGIKDTAAGTTIVNMMANMQGTTRKAANALKELGMNFSDVTGKAKPTYEAMKEFDTLLNKYDTSSQKSFITDIFSKQGIKDVTELRALLHEAADDTSQFSNKFEELQAKIVNSAGASTIQSVQMSLTSENQIKSVWNTLKTSMEKAFSSTGGVLDVITYKLRAAFGSPEFVTGISNLASAAASLVSTFIEWSGPLEAVAEGLFAVKTISATMALTSTLEVPLLAVARAFGAVAVAEGGATVATGVFATAMSFIPGLGIAIGVVTAAMILFNFHSNSMKDHAIETAEAYRGNYLNALKDEADKLQRTVDLLRQGAPLQDAQTQAIKDQARAQADLNNQKAIGAAQAEVDKLQKTVDNIDPNVEGQGVALLMYASQLKTAKAELDSLKGSVSSFNSEVDKNLANIKKNSAEVKAAYLADQAAAEAKAQAAAKGGTARAAKPDKGAIADGYNEALKVYTDDIKAAQQALAQFDETENAKFKAGEIGRVQVINETADKQIATYKRLAADAEKAKAVADKSTNKTADSKRFEDEAKRANESAEHAEKMRTDNMVEAHKQAETIMTNLKIKSLNDQGKYVEAANLKWSSDGQLALQQAQDDLKKYGDMFPWLAGEVAAYGQMQKDAMDSAQVKQDTEAFNIALTQTQETLKGLKTAQFGNSIDTIFASATKASEDFNKKIEVATKKRNDLFVTALATGTPQAIKAYEDANKALLAVGDDQKKMWESVGATITTALGNAFGSAGTSLGQLNQAMIAYNQSENATAEDRAKQYGDMAQAASGFFNKQSMGYKALNGIAQVFHIAEMARTLVRTVAYVAEGAANMFGQAGFGGFAGVAAMGAVMAGLGFAASGASSHGADPKLDAEYVQKNQGTGTVLGDATAKSASIADSISALKNNSDVTLPINQAMLESLQSIDASMKGLGRMLVQGGVTNGSNFGIQTGNLGGTGLGTIGNGLVGGAAGAGVGYMAGAGLTAFTSLGAIGGPIGMAIGAVVGAVVSKLWGKTTQTIVDSGIQFGGTVKSLENGQGIDQYAAVKTDKSSWFGLSKSSSTDVKTMGAGDQISSQFGLVFSNLETSLKSAASALGTSGDAVGKAIDNMVITTTKISLQGLTGTALTDAINNVVSAAMDQIASAAYPQMQAFQQVGEGYAQTVMRVASGVEQADVALKQLGVTAINYQDIQNKQGDVAFELAKQSILASEGVGGVADMLKNMTGSITDLTTAYKALDAIRTQMKAMGMSETGLNSDFVTGAGGLTQLQSAMTSYQDKYFTDQEKAGIMLQTVAAQFGKLGVALPATRSALRALIDQTSVSNPLLSGQLIALAGSYDSLATAAETATKTQTDALNTTIDNLNKFSDTLKSFKDSLALGDSSILNPTDKYNEAKRQYEDTVSKAQGGDATAQGNVTSAAQAYLDASRTINASSQGYTDTYNQVMSDMDKLGASTDGQLSNAEKQLAALQDQSSALDALNATATSMKTDLDTLASSVSAPVASAAPVAVDTSALEAQITELRTQLADAQAANAQQMSDLMGVVYDANAQNAKQVSTAVTNTAVDTAWAAQTKSTLNTER